MWGGSMTQEESHDAEEKNAAIAPIIVCLPSSPRWVKDTFRKKVIRDEQEGLLIDQQHASQMDVVNALWESYADALSEKNVTKEIEMLVLAAQSEKEQDAVRRVQVKEENFEFDFGAFSYEVQWAFEAHDKGLQEHLTCLDDESKNQVKQCLSATHLSQMYLHAENHVASWDEATQKNVQDKLCRENTCCEAKHSLATNLVLAMMKPMVDKACSPGVDEKVKKRLVNHGRQFCREKIPTLIQELRPAFEKYNNASRKSKTWCGKAQFDQAKALLKAIKAQAGPDAPPVFSKKQ